MLLEELTGTWKRGPAKMLPSFETQWVILTRSCVILNEFLATGENFSDCAWGNNGYLVFTRHTYKNMLLYIETYARLLKVIALRTFQLLKRVAWRSAYGANCSRDLLYSEIMAVGSQKPVSHCNFMNYWSPFAPLCSCKEISSVWVARVA